MRDGLDRPAAAAPRRAPPAAERRDRDRRVCAACSPTCPADAIEHGLQTADWPARLQRLSKGVLADLAPPGAELWLDGGHNEDGGRALGQAMADLEDRIPRPLVVDLRHAGDQGHDRLPARLRRPGAGGDRRACRGRARRPPGPRRRCLRHPAAGLPAAACQGVEQALTYLRARAWSAPPRVLIAGSLYLAGAVLEANGTPPV